FSIFTVGYALIENIQKITKAIFKNVPEKILERGLMILDNVSDLTDVVNSVISGLEAFGAIAETTATTAGTYLCGIGTILSLASIILAAKHFYEAFQFHKRLEEKFGNGPDQEQNFKDV